MKIDRIIYTPGFVKKSKKLPQRIKDKVVRKEKIFQKNAFHSSLKTHALSGNLKGFHSFSIDYSYRIVFRFINRDKAVVFIDVGTHSIYK